MATFSTNQFVSCSAENVKALSWGCGGAEFWHRIEAYHFWLSTTCCLKMPVFCMLDTLCRMQHVVLYSWRILAVFSLYLGILYDDGPPHR